MGKMTAAPLLAKLKTETRESGIGSPTGRRRLSRQHARAVNRSGGAFRTRPADDRSSQRQGGIALALFMTGALAARAPALKLRPAAFSFDLGHLLALALLRLRLCYRSPAPAV